MLYLYQIDVNETDDDSKYSVLSKVHEYCARVFLKDFLTFFIKMKLYFLLKMKQIQCSIQM